MQSRITKLCLLALLALVGVTILIPIGRAQQPSGGALPDKVANEKLLAAIRNADASAVRALLAGSADANARDEDDLTALMHVAMYAGVDCMELVLAKGADPNAKSKADVTALMLAVGDAAKVRMLLAHGAEVNAKSQQGHTALTLAAGRAGSVEVVRLLLDHGAKLADKNILGAAAHSGDIRVVKLLLEKGADPNDKKNLGGAPPVTAKRLSERSKGRPQDFLPLGLGGNIGGTPLMFAAITKNIEVMKLLLEKGADVNARTSRNGTALMLAAQIGDPAAVKLLLEKGAEINVRDEIGYTALLYAAVAECNDPAALKALLARGAEINIKGNDGETALKLAGRKGNTAIVRLLKQAGAKE